MIRSRLPFLLGVLLLAGLRMCPAQTPLPSDDTVRAILRQGIDDQLAVGLIVGLVDADGSTRFVACGSTSPGGAPVDEHTIFEIGSVTKTFTGALMALAIERGAMHRDDPASKYLPPALKLPTHNGKEITLQDLATQRSGLPNMPENARPADPDNPFADYTAAQLGGWLGSLALDRDPGSAYEYSNVGFGVLGQALCHQAGLDYEALVGKEICGPLKLPDTIVTLSAEQRARLARPFDEALDPTVNWELPALAGAGALRSDAVDMARYVAANLGPVEPSLVEAFAAAHQSRGAGRGQNQIGFAWQISPRHGRTITWHNGGTAGYHAFVGLDLAAKHDVVILANSANSIDDIGFHLLDPESALTKSASPPFALAPAERDPYVGSYAFAADFVVQISRKGSRYFAQATGQGKLELFPEFDADFFLRAVDARITFVRDGAGKVASLVLHQRGDQTARRLP